MTSSEDTTSSLPADLLMAEAQLQNAVIAALASGAARRWSANLRFENLRVLPVALRLARALLAKDCPVLVVWPDAGAAALARRCGRPQRRHDGFQSTEAEGVEHS